MNLKGKNVVLTGASSGIGLELLPLLHQKGAKVLAIGRRPFTPDYDSITYLQEDISTQIGVENVFKKAEEVLGSIDIFIANAGFAYYESVQNADWIHSQKIFDTNFMSPIFAFQQMKKMKGTDPFQFVVTASAVSYMPLPGYALYSATKHAIRSFFEVAKLELPSNQIITLIHPISTKTEFFKKDTPIPFLSQTAKTVAKSYMSGIEKNRLHIFPSAIFKVIRHLGFMYPIVMKMEAKQFSKWRNQHE